MQKNKRENTDTFLGNNQEINASKKIDQDRVVTLTNETVQIYWLQINTLSLVLHETQSNDLNLFSLCSLLPSIYRI